MDVRAYLLSSIVLLGGCNTLADLKLIENEEPKGSSIADCELSVGSDFSHFQVAGFLNPRITLLADSDRAVLAAGSDGGGTFARFATDSAMLPPLELPGFTDLDDLSLTRDKNGFGFSASHDKPAETGIDIAFGNLEDPGQQTMGGANEGFTATASVGGINPYGPQDSALEFSRFVWVSPDEILFRGQGVLEGGAEHEGALGSVMPGDLLSSPGPHVFHWSPTRLAAIDVFGALTAVSTPWDEGQTRPTGLAYLGANRYLFALHEGEVGKIVSVVVQEEGIEVQPAFERTWQEDTTAFSIFPGEGFIGVVHISEGLLRVDFYEYEGEVWQLRDEHTLAGRPEFRASSVQGAIFQDPDDRCSIQLWVAGVDDANRQINVVHTQLAP